MGFVVVPKYDRTVKCVTGPAATAKYPPSTVLKYRTNRFAAGAGAPSA